MTVFKEGSTRKARTQEQIGLKKLNQVQKEDRNGSLCVGQSQDIRLSSKIQAVWDSPICHFIFFTCWSFCYFILMLSFLLDYDNLVNCFAVINNQREISVVVNSSTSISLKKARPLYFVL